MKFKRVRIYGLEYCFPEKDYFYYEQNFLKNFDAYEIEDCEGENCKCIPDWLRDEIRAKYQTGSTVDAPCEGCGSSEHDGSSKRKKKSAGGSEKSATGSGTVEEKADAVGSGVESHSSNEHAG